MEQSDSKLIVGSDTPCSHILNTYVPSEQARWCHRCGWFKPDNGPWQPPPKSSETPDNSPAPTVKESLTVPPPLKVGDVVDGRDPAQLARIPVGAETVYMMESGRGLPVLRKADWFEQTEAAHGWSVGIKWTGHQGTHRIVSLPPGYGEAEGKADDPTGHIRCSGCGKSLRERVLYPGPIKCRVCSPPTPPAPVEADEAIQGYRMQVNMSIGVPYVESVKSDGGGWILRSDLTARDAAIRAEERRRCEAELERAQKRIIELQDMRQSLEDCMVSREARIAELERYVGGQMLRSDFRTADEMRAALDAANARIAQSGKGVEQNHLEAMESNLKLAEESARSDMGMYAAVVQTHAAIRSLALHAAAQEGRP